MRTVVIAGATGGLGYEIVKKHLAFGDKVLGVDRAKSERLFDENYKEFQVDVSDTQDVKAVCNALMGEIEKIDLLYYTIAAPQTEDTEEIDKFDIDYALDIYNINVLGALRLIQNLLPVLNRSSKVCLVTSKNGSMHETRTFMQYGVKQMLAYNMSKAALNMAGLILHEKFSDKGIGFLLIHPGSMKTKMSNFMGKNEPSVSAEGIVTIMLKENEEKIFLSYTGDEIEW